MTLAAEARAADDVRMPPAPCRDMNRVTSQVIDKNTDSDYMERPWKQPNANDANDDLDGDVLSDCLEFDRRATVTHT